MLASTSTSRFHDAYSQMVGDLSGDGRRDDLWIDERGQIVDNTFHVRTTITAVEGATGKKLWRRVVRRSDTIVLPYGARVGTHQGVVLIGVKGFHFQTTSIDYSIEGIDSHGKRVWSQEFDSTIVGEWPIAFVGVDYLTAFDFFNGLPGPATDVLVATGDVTYPPDWALRSGVVTASVIDGRDGTLVHHPLPEAGVGVIPAAASFGDLNGDHLDDYVFATIRPGQTVDPGDGSPSVSAADGVVDARAGTDGLPIWSAQGISLVQENIMFTNVGDVVGSRSGDVSVETDSELLGRGSNRDHTYMIDGSTGKLAWRNLGQWPFSPGDTNGDRRKDVLTETVYSGKGFAATKVWAWDPSGSPLWSRVYRTDNPLTTCCTAMFHFGPGSWAAGDVNGDGLKDGFIENWAFGRNFGPTTKIEHLIISGSNGRVLARGNQYLSPVGLPVNGGTDDIVIADVAFDGDLHVRVLDGSTGRTITDSKIALRVPLSADANVYTTGAYLGRDSCADLIVDVHASVGGQATLGAASIALDGATGRITWSRTAGALAGTPPHVVAATDHNHHC